MRSAWGQQPGALVGRAAHTGIPPGRYLRRRGVASSTRKRESAKPTPEERRPRWCQGRDIPRVRHHEASDQSSTPPCVGCRSRDLVRA